RPVQGLRTVSHLDLDHASPRTEGEPLQLRPDQTGPASPADPTIDQGLRVPTSRMDLVRTEPFEFERDLPLRPKFPEPRERPDPRDQDENHDRPERRPMPRVIARSVRPRRPQSPCREPEGCREHVGEPKAHAP